MSRVCQDGLNSIHLSVIHSKECQAPLQLGDGWDEAEASGGIKFFQTLYLSQDTCLAGHH